MNYLAHAYLSFGEPEILVGNMISDFVKGRKKFSYSENIQKGITIHREIDQFTDSHEATKNAMLFFKPVYRLYSGAFIDIVYDHFLATDTSVFPDQASLLTFTENTYSTLSGFEGIFPEQFSLMFPFMKKNNWLYNYQFHEGIKRSFGGLVKRAKFLDESESALLIFEKHYTEIHKCYQAFFPALTQDVLKNLQLLSLK